MGRHQRCPSISDFMFLRQVMLAVTASNAAAMALYESMGFNAIWHEPDALQVDGVMYDEVQMVRRVETAT